MRGIPINASSLATLFVGLAMADEVSAAKIPIPIPVIFGHGEEIAYLCDLPSGVKKQVCEQLGVDDVAVGFFYKRFHIFWIDAWTWGGFRVLFKGDQYWNPPQEAWEAILGKEAGEGLSRPFLYRFPLSWVLVGALLLLGISKSFFLPSVATRIRRLLKDHRYPEALQIYFDNLAPPEGAPGAEPPPEGETLPAMDPAAAFRSAREHLVRHGIASHEAEDNLGLLLAAMASGYRARQTGIWPGAGA